MYEELSAYFEALEKHSEPTEAIPPDSTAHFPVGFLEVTGTSLIFCDSWATPFDGVSVTVPSGTYSLSVEIQAYGNDGRVSRLIVELLGTKGVRGKEIGTFGVDVASAAVCDGDALESFANHRKTEWEAWLDGFIQQPYEQKGLLSHFPCEPAATDIFHTSTGFGDGSYPVYALIEGECVVGAEAVFLLPQQSYFGPGPGEDDA